MEKIGHYVTVASSCPSDVSLVSLVLMVRARLRLHLAVGLLEPSNGNVQVLGGLPRQALPRVGFVAQDRPLYRTFCVEDMLILGQKLNPHWDMDLATEREHFLTMKRRESQFL